MLGRCALSGILLIPGYPFSWYKNGKLVFGQGTRVKISSNKLLVLNTQLDDQGVYQCFGLSEGQSFQASTEIVFEGKLELNLFQTQLKVNYKKLLKFW